MCMATYTIILVDCGECRKEENHGYAGQCRMKNIAQRCWDIRRRKKLKRNEWTIDENNV